MSAAKVAAIDKPTEIVTPKVKRLPYPFKDKRALDFDMLYQLSSMSVIASAGVPRKLIFEHASRLPCSAAEYFKKIDLTCEKLKYDYAKGCRLVAENTKETKMREFLLRFSSSLLSGEPEADFLVRETKALADDYDNDYGRKLEGLKLWSDAYVSLILSAVLIIIMGIVSTMIWPVSMGFLFGLVILSAGTTAIGVWILYLMSPREPVVVRVAGSREQKLGAKIFRMGLPAVSIVGALIILMKLNTGWFFLAVAAFAFPIGLVMEKDDKQVAKRDSEIGTFLASLGGICGAIGTTVKEALSRIDLESLNCLRNDVKRLYVRLKSGITPGLCWQKLIEETGSELVNRTVGMFYDAIAMGGDAEQAGHNAFLFSSKVATLRAKRRTIAIPFRWLTIAMHMAVVGLLVFITEVITRFGNMIGQAEKSMPQVGGSSGISAFSTFNIAGLSTLHTMVVPLLLVFTVANTMAPAIVEGGSWYKAFFNLGILASVSGLSLLILPALATALFKTVQI